MSFVKYLRELVSPGCNNIVFQALEMSFSYGFRKLLFLSCCITAGCLVLQLVVLLLQH